MVLGLKKESELKKFFFQIRCNLGLQCQNCKPKIKPTNYFGLQTHLLKITNSRFVARELIQARILFIHMLFLLYMYFLEEAFLLGFVLFVSFTNW